jgi:hypothetical protein
VLLCVASAGAAQASAPVVPAPTAQEIETSLFLIGDAGHADRPDHPVIFALREKAGANPAHAQILFLGDSAYPEGLPEKAAPLRAAAEVRLNTHVDAARASGAPTIFIPGNHDLGQDAERRLGPGATRGRVRGRSRGWQRPVPPGRRLPGPIKVEVGRSVRLVLLDTQWWLLAGHDHGLQVLSGGGVRHVLVGGSGSYDHNNTVKRLASTRYAADKPGFMRLDILQDGRVRLGVLLVDASGRATEAYAAWLD